LLKGLTKLASANESRTSRCLTELLAAQWLLSSLLLADCLNVLQFLNSVLVSSNFIGENLSFSSNMCVITNSWKSCRNSRLYCEIAASDKNRGRPPKLQKSCLLRLRGFHLTLMSLKTLSGVKFC